MEVAKPYFKTVFFLYSLRGEGFVPYESFFGKTFVCNCWYFNIVSCEWLSFENLKIGSLDMNVLWDGCLSDVAQKKFPFVNTSLTCSICKYNLYQFFNACGLHFTICCKKSSIRFFSICIWSGRDVRGPFYERGKRAKGVIIVTCPACIASVFALFVTVRGRPRNGGVRPRETWDEIIPSPTRFRGSAVIVFFVHVSKP